MSYLADKYSIIDSLPLFVDLSFQQKRFIASKTEVGEFQKGKVIYNEGDPPDYFYCMVSGRVEIYHPPEKTKKRQKFRIECVRRGDYFGSISSLTGQPHTVSARALNDSIILKISAEDFSPILRKIPRLAVVLNYSLSRRLGRKGVKEIFESTIIGIYGDGPDSSSYAAALAAALRKESGKKVRLIISSLISNKKEVSPKLNSFTGDYHYVLVDIRGGLTQLNLEILKQSDVRHIVSFSDRNSLDKTSSLIKRLEESFNKQLKRTAFVILKEDDFYLQASYQEKQIILSRKVFASLPKGKINYNKAIRRIAREISGVRVGLVLGSGAAMGFAHIGVLKVLEKERVPVDIISATSIGALIGTLWAAGFTANQIEKLACSFKSKLRSFFLIDPTLPVRGLIKGGAVRRILKSYLGNKTFFDLKMPLKIVACDIKGRREFIIDKGSLVDAVMASIAIPGVFEPFEYGKGIQLVDGGIVNPVPVRVLSRMGIKRIIAVNTLPSPADMVRLSRKRLNIYDIIVNSFQAMEFTIAEDSCRQADVYIHPIPELADWYEFYKANLFIKSGREHTTRALVKIKALVKR